MNEWAFPIWYFFPTKFHQCLFQLSFTQESCEWVTVQVSFKVNNGICNEFPWLRPFIFWKTCPFIRTFQNVPNTSISGQSERILLTILPRISILLLRNYGSQCKKLILCSCWVVLFANSQYRSTQFLGMTFHIVGPRRNTQIFRAWIFSDAPAEILDPNMVL